MVTREVGVPYARKDLPAWKAIVVECAEELAGAERVSCAGEIAGAMAIALLWIGI